MPGTMLSAECVCGYKIGLRPGFSVLTLKSDVIAYTADMSALITIDSDAAEQARLKIIEDPTLNRDPLDSAPRPADLYERSWGPYLCPSCKKRSLRFFFWGNWD